MNCPEFSPKDPAEVNVYGFDFSKLLSTSETISTASFSVSLVFGASDPSPLLLVGSTDISSAPVVKQKLQAGTAGNTYRVRATATTSQGRVIVASALVPVAVGAC